MKIYYKTKILINGIIPSIDFKIDGFTQKTGVYDEKVIDSENDDYIFYSSSFIIKGTYSCAEKEGNFYEYFENDNYFEKEVPSDISKDDLQRLIMIEQIEKVRMIEKKLRLISGLGINLPVFKTNIYDSKKELFTYVGNVNWSFTPLSASDYDDSLKNKLVQRLHFHLFGSTLENLENKNERFKRSLYFYTNSFSSPDIGIRFTLLFSALESLFNITGNDITEEVANYSSRILFLSNKERKKSKYKIKTYYNERSRFIHGNNSYSISSEIENKLRDYVREILLIYWNISMIYKIYDAKKIKELVFKTNRDSLHIKVQLFIKYLRTDPKNYKQLYYKLMPRLLNNEHKILSNEHLTIDSHNPS